VPGFVRQFHLDHDIAGEELAFSLHLFTAAHFRHFLDGNDHFPDQMGNTLLRCLFPNRLGNFFLKA